jgi:uncharacterized membrane protein
VRRILVPLAAVLALLAGIVGGASAQESGESEILAVDVHAVVNPDGSMDVLELLSYDFTADRNGGFRNFLPGGADYSIEDFEVTEGGDHRDLPAGYDDPNSGGDVRWFGSADHSKVNGRHDYELRYHVEGAVDVFSDVAVLNWQFIGSSFPALGRVTIDVAFPGDGTDIRAFAHGVLHGVVGIEGNRVTLTVVDNPAGSIVEARVLVPASAFTVPPSGGPVLDQILAEEAALADQANADRLAAREQLEEAFRLTVEAGMPDDCDSPDGDVLESRCADLADLLEEAEPRVGAEITPADAALLLDIRAARADIRDEVDRQEDEQRRMIGNVVAVAVALVGALAGFLIWRRWGKEPPRPPDVGDYWRDIPPESPAIIASLDDWGTVDSKAFASTVIDLAQRGWLTITEQDDDYVFTRSQKAEGEDLRDYEARVLWRLFPTGRAAVSQDELADEATESRTSSAAWMQEFRQEVAADYQAQGYMQHNGCLPWLLYFVVFAAVTALGVLALVVGAWFGIAALAVALALLVYFPLLRQRTPAGARKTAEIQGLRRFLKDFSLVDDVPVGAMAIYERYLVYAVALGVAKELLAGLRVRFPQLAEAGSGFAPWYVYGIHADGGDTLAGGFDRIESIGSLGSFADDFASATASAFSPPSSSSGSGGGFSGGGGFSSGGGGGGGAGSW